MRWTTIARMSGVLLALAAVGCGGGGPDGKTAKDAKGGTVQSSSGDAVTQEAYDAWNAALETFNRFEEEGWNGQKCEQAISAFSEADNKQSGTFAEAVYMQGVAASRCGDHEKALGFFEEALDTSPKMCKARAAVGLDHLRKGRTQKARSEFERAIDDDARCKEAYVNLAIIQREAGGDQIDAARKNLRRAMAVESEFLPAFNELALVFLAEAQGGKEQSLDLGEIVCRQAQLLDNAYAPIYNTWGLIKMERGDIIEALRFFGKARELDDDMFAAHMNFGEVTLGFRGYQDAHASFKRAVELQPNDYEAVLGLGAALRGLEKYGEAEAQYKKAMEMDKARPESYFNLGILYQDYKQGTIEDLETAKKYLKQFLQKAKGKAEYSDKIERVENRCRMDDQMRPVPRSCRPGRLQNIDNALDVLKEMEAMQQGGGGGGGGS